MRLAEFWYRSPLYQLLLRGRSLAHLSRIPPPPWRGDAGRGPAILEGMLPTGGRHLRLTPDIWVDKSLPLAAQAELHGFGWLDDVAAIGDAQAAAAAQRLVASWIETSDRWSACAWSPAVLGVRIGAWLGHARLIAPQGDDPLAKRILQSLVGQAFHLQKVAMAAAEGIDRLRVLRALIYAANCGLRPPRTGDRALRWLSRELRRQILPDGSHVSRSPRIQVHALAALVDIRNMLIIAEQQPPHDLLHAIDAMAPVVQFFRHRDGALSHFNGASEDEALPIDPVLAATKPGAQPPDAAGGFHRLAAGDALVLADCGAPAPPGFDGDCHAGSLSFEMSWGRERLIVNCGAGSTLDSHMRRAEKSTAAHSTLTIDDTNSSEILADAIGTRASVPTCQRDTAEGSIWLDASHDGYQAPFGMMHRRRLYLSRNGDDLRGEDTLTGPHSGSFMARFHLHPTVHASLIQTGAAVLLRQRSGAAWRFQATGGRLDLAESIYLERTGRRRAEQIVVSGPLEGHGARLKWALKKIDV